MGSHEGPVNRSDIGGGDGFLAALSACKTHVLQSIMWSPSNRDERVTARDVVQTVLLIYTVSIQEVLAASSVAWRGWFRCDEGKHPERKAVIQKPKPPGCPVWLCATMPDVWPPWETRMPAAPVYALMSAEETCQRKQARLWWNYDPSAGSGFLLPSYSSTIYSCSRKK